MIGFWKDPQVPHPDLSKDEDRFIGIAIQDIFRDGGFDLNGASQDFFPAHIQ